MKTEITLRYALEFSIIIPAALFAFMPVNSYMRFTSLKSYIMAGVLLILSVFVSAYFCSLYMLRIRDIFIPYVLIFFALYSLSVNLSLNKKLFCFFNSMMICSVGPLYTILAAAPDELTNPLWFTLKLFTIRSGLICLGLTVLTGIIFFRTLTKKIPMLLREESIKNAWRHLFVIPLVMSLLIYWMTPNSPVVVMTGRVRSISLVLYFFTPFSVFMFYHIFWWTTERITERARLQQENTFLVMESRRYDELRRYMEHTRTLRHDFRQHMLVISQLAESNDTEKLRSYISQMNISSGRSYISYCMNSATDALAAHYDSIARSNGTRIDFRLEIPSELPVKEADFCAMLGNLIENALRAVKNLPEESRHIKVISMMLSSAMLGVSVSNHYDGTISFGNNGLPVSESESDEGHGVGLISVSNTVKRYGGSMNINTEDNTFSVDIILYCNS